MAFSGMSRRVAFVRTDVSEELSVSFITVTRIDALGTTLAVPSSSILVTLMKEALNSTETLVPKEPHEVTYKKTLFFIVTAVKI
jgi:hypothetical protein